MYEKISAEEIQQLRYNANKERETHAQIMQEILKEEFVGKIIYPERQLEIVKRQREDEVVSLLEALVERKSEVCEAAQLYIYDREHNMPEAREYMLTHVALCLEVEKKIFDDKEIPYLYEVGTSARNLSFSPQGEVYMIEQTLASCQKANRITSELIFFNEYTAKRALSAAGQMALLLFLRQATGRDSVIDGLENAVVDYITRHSELAPNAELALVATGNHRVIMHYIKRSKHGMSGDEAIEALLHRADRREVTAYFERYAQDEE